MRVAWQHAYGIHDACTHAIKQICVCCQKVLLLHVCSYPVQVVRSYDDYTGTINSVAFHPDGTAVASGGTDNTIKVSMRPGRKATTPACQAVADANLSPEFENAQLWSQSFATCSPNATVALWSSDGEPECAEQLL